MNWPISTRDPRVWVGGLILAMALVPVFTVNNYLLSFGFLTLMYASLSVGWNIIGGYAEYQSFGHAAFVGLGGYTTAVLLSWQGWSPLITAVLGAVIAGVVAIIIGVLVLRLQGAYFSVVTLLAALILLLVIKLLPVLEATAGIFLSAPAESVTLSSVILYYAMLGVVTVTILVARWIERSRYGIGLFAIREDEEVASVQGIDTTYLKIFAFTISAGLAGLAGGFYSWYIGYVVPEPMFSLNISILVVLMSLVGGTDTWVGPFVGALLIRTLQEVLTLLISGPVANTILGLVLIGVILYLPSGIVPLIRSRLKQSSFDPFSEPEPKEAN
ncbi:branched-chain amino acid ABC transporter permease [Halorarius halobius]|uniref:branched-chain amino acid ABC transporter permease n=1 Tax=Halorarius halobius TaxID=2962671 RepID=UPI0020CC8098|nr:branched-chain amino acid ABC transporter permease [Halorarius halobius]